MFFSFLLIAIFFFAGVAKLTAHQFGVEKMKKDNGQVTLIDVIRDGESIKLFGEVWSHIRPTKRIQKNITLDENRYIYVWEPRRDLKAPEKGWLIVENSFYRISVNLDRSYYLIFDKTADRDVLFYDDDVDEEVEDPLNILTGSDIGFSDHAGDNPNFFATTALHDLDGIGRYDIRWEDTKRGFLLIGLEGWDFQPKDNVRGFDVEAEMLLGIFADKPYFIDATEITNIQGLGIFPEKVPYKDPDEIVKSWVIRRDYDSAVIKGGDLGHLNRELWRPWYEVKTINGQGRKPWHFGSAQFSKMFPKHKLIGKKEDGGIIFSLPEGIFRFDESRGVYGDQIVGEFLIVIEQPKKAIAFSAEPVNEYDYFYDAESYNEDYRKAMLIICANYHLICPESPLDWHNWETKRFAYVITLINEWYDPGTNQPYESIWALADQGLEDFKIYEDRILLEMEKTEPLIASDTF